MCALGIDFKNCIFITHLKYTQINRSFLKWMPSTSKYLCVLEIWCESFSKKYELGKQSHLEKYLFEPLIYEKKSHKNQIPPKIGVKITFFFENSEICTFVCK